MVTQWFKYMFGRCKAVFLNRVATHHERGNYIDGFQRANSSLGTSVTLNVAERMVLDCCPYVLRDEEQAHARIDRTGNLNCQVTTYPPIADARLEANILRKQARHKAIVQAAIDTTL